MVQVPFNFILPFIDEMADDSFYKLFSVCGVVYRLSHLIKHCLKGGLQKLFLVLSIIELML